MPIIPTIRFNNQLADKQIDSIEKKFDDLAKRIPEVDRRVYQNIDKFISQRVAANYIANARTKKPSRGSVELKRRFKEKNVGIRVTASGGTRPVKFISLYGRLTGFLEEKLKENKFPSTQYMLKTIRKSGSASEMVWGIILQHFYREYPRLVFRGSPIVRVNARGRSLIQLSAADVRTVQSMLAEQHFIKNFNLVFGSGS